MGLDAAVAGEHLAAEVVDVNATMDTGDEARLNRRSADGFYQPSAEVEAIDSQAVQEGAPSDSSLEASREVFEFVRGLLPASATFHLEEGIGRLAAQRLNLVVLGEFKRGKSTLVNALLGRSILPTGVVPLTAAVTVVRKGSEDRLVVRFLDGREEDHPVAVIADFVTESGNPKNARGIERVTVETSAPLLQDGLQIVDTPGIGSLHTHNTDTATSFLPQVDAALFVLAADQPLSQAERELIEEAQRRIPRLLFAANRIDAVPPGERSSALAFIEQALAELVGTGTDLVAVSALSGWGVDDLRQRLERLRAKEREETLSASIGALAAGLARRGAEAAALETRAIELPLVELERRARLFEERVEAMRTARDEARDLLDRNVAGALDRALERPLEAASEELRHSVVAELEAAAAEAGGISARRLATLLEDRSSQIIHDRFTELAARLQTTVADELETLERRYAKRVSAIAEELAAVAAEIFGTRGGVEPSQIGLQAPSRFSFKLTDEQQALEQLVDLGRTMLPGRLGRTLVLRNARRRLLELFDRHAGRLRADLRDRSLDSVSRYQRELAFLVDEGIASVETAIERATREHGSHALRFQSRLEELAQIRERLRTLADELES
jgi:small GTP-binding protein